MLARLHQSQVPFRQRQVAGAGQETQDRNVRHGIAAGVADLFGMTRAADSIENDAGDVDAGPVVGEAAEHGGGRGALGANVDHHDDGPPCRESQIGGRSRGRRRAVEQAHHAFANDEIGVQR